MKFVVCAPQIFGVRDVESTPQVKRFPVSTEAYLKACHRHNDGFVTNGVTDGRTSISCPIAAVETAITKSDNDKLFIADNVDRTGIPLLRFGSRRPIDRENTVHLDAATHKEATVEREQHCTKNFVPRLNMSLLHKHSSGDVSVKHLQSKAELCQTQKTAKSNMSDRHSRGPLVKNTGSVVAPKRQQAMAGVKKGFRG